MDNPELSKGGAVESGRKSNIHEIEIFEELYSGNVPHPALLQAFEEIRPGSADDFFGMVKYQQKHEHRMDFLDRLLPFVLEISGQILTFILAAGFIGGGIYLLISGQNIGGYTSLVAGVASIVIPILLSRKSPAMSKEGATEKSKEESTEESTEKSTEDSS